MNEYVPYWFDLILSNKMFLSTQSAFIGNWGEEVGGDTEVEKEQAEESDWTNFRNDIFYLVIFACLSPAALAPGADNIEPDIETQCVTSCSPLTLPSLHLPAQPCRLFRSNIEQLREARTLVQNVRTCLDSYRSRMLLLQRPYIITSAQQSHVKDHPMSWPQYRNGCAVPSNHLCTAPVSTINLFSPKDQRGKVHHPLATVPTSSVKIVPTMMMIVEPRM